MAKKTRKELDTSKELALIMFMSGLSQNEIANRVGISNQTMTAWVNDNNWKEKRAAKTITRVELINLALEKISKILEDPTNVKADELVKLAAFIEKLDKKNSPVIAMEIFIAFLGFMQSQATIDKNISLDFIKALNKYQDAYVTQLMNGQ